MQYVAGFRNLFLAFDKEAHAATLDDRHLLVWMIVFRSHQKRLEPKAADHHAIADKHLPLDSLGGLLNRDVGPVQMLGEMVAVVGHLVPLLFVTDSFQTGSAGGILRLYVQIGRA